MANRIFGGLGLVWGLVILVNWFTSAVPADAPPAYHQGRIAAAIFGALLVLIGGYYLLKKNKPKEKK